MRATEISYHRLQEIKLLLKLHIQLASIDEIIWLTINMPFGPVGYQHEVMADKHSETYGNYKEKQAGHMEQIDIPTRDLPDKTMTWFTRERFWRWGGKRD